VVNQANASTTPVFNMTVGGMALVYVVDTTTPANYFYGIAYIPPGTLSAVTVTNTGNNVLTVSTISVTGVITASGGSGNYIIYGQQQQLPA
jgi:hypothetical protein